MPEISDTGVFCFNGGTQSDGSYLGQVGVAWNPVAGSDLPAVDGTFIVEADTCNLGGSYSMSGEYTAPTPTEGNTSTGSGSISASVTITMA